MERTRHAWCISVMLGFCLAWPTVSHATPPIPEEPGDERLVTQFYDTIAGLLIREYSLQGNGRVDYRTARQIMWVSFDDPAAEALDVAPYPILYWHDADQSEEWELWVDRDGDGHVGNVVRYDVRQDGEVMAPSKIRRWQ